MKQVFKFKLNSRFYSNTSKKCSEILSSNKIFNQHNLINGHRLNGEGSTFNNYNPATGELLCEVSSASNSQLENCIKSAHTAQKEWNKLSNEDKARVMTTAAQLIRKRYKNIATIDVLDTGKPFWEAEADILACATTIELFGDYIGTIEGTHVSLPENNFYYTRKEPLGVCAGIGAWNFPFQMISWKSAPALAAGNGFIFKPSPLTPLSAVLLAEIYHEAGVPSGLVSVVQGGSEVGKIITENSQISKISFTGSVPTGKKIMHSSADTLKYLTLELGGKSPLIIFDDTDIDEAVKGIMLANFLTQGEVCSNGTRVFIQSKIYNKVVDKLVDAVKSLKIGDPFDPDVGIGAIISEDQLQIIMNYIEKGKSEGGKLLYGGERIVFNDTSKFKNGWFISPCVFGECRDDMTIVREEIFGPVASLLTFEDEEEVVTRANDSDFGLAGGVFTNQLARAHRVAANLQCGSIYINTYNAYPPGIPFGGYKSSGLGRENCRQTLDHYLQLKSIYVENNPIYYPFWNVK